MIFKKDGKTLEVKEKAHIDCLKAKGWTPVKGEKAKASATGEEKSKE